MNQNKYLMSVLWLTATASTVSYAEEPSQNAINATTEHIRENLREIKQLESTLREDAAWSLQQAQAKSAEQNQAQDEQIQQQQTACLDFASVRIEGMTLIDAQPYQAKLAECVSGQSLNQLSRDIVAGYLAKGYINPKIEFVEQDNQLIVQVKESIVGEIEGKNRRVNTTMLFPHLKHQPLSVHKLDQAIEQANKVIGNQVSVDVYPQEDGTVSLAVQNNAGKAWSGSVTIDNKGSRQQPEVVRLNMGIGSPLGLSDNMYLSAYSNLRQDDERYSRGGNIFYSVPYGNWSFSAYGGLSTSLSMVETTRSKLPYKSESTSAGIKAERVISRGSKHITQAYTGMDYLNVEQVYGGSRINLQSPRLSALSVGLSHSQMLKNGIFINDVKVEQGTRAFGASDRSALDTIYTRYLLDSSLYQSHRAGKWLIRNQHRLSAQYSEEDLYSAKQFAVSERGNVRGFKSVSLDGTKGVALNNTVMARYYTSKGFFVEPYIGADAGVVRDDRNRFKGFGLTTGINIGSGRVWQLSVENSRAFMHHNTAPNQKDEQVTATFRINF